MESAVPQALAPEVLPIDLEGDGLAENQGRLAKFGRATTALVKKSMNLLWADTSPSRRERMMIGGAMSSIGVFSTLAEMKLGVHINHPTPPVEYVIDSGRHFAVGAAGAGLVKRGSKLDNTAGILAAAVGADLAAEVGQDLLVTGVVHDGWRNLGDVSYPSEWLNTAHPLNGNLSDLSASLLAAVGFRTRLWFIERKKRRLA